MRPRTATQGLPETSHCVLEESRETALWPDAISQPHLPIAHRTSSTDRPLQSLMRTSQLCSSANADKLAPPTVHRTSRTHSIGPSDHSYSEFRNRAFYPLFRRLRTLVSSYACVYRNQIFVIHAQYTPAPPDTSSDHPTKQSTPDSVTVVAGARGQRPSEPEIRVVRHTALIQPQVHARRARVRTQRARGTTPPEHSPSRIRQL